MTEPGFRRTVLKNCSADLWPSPNLDGGSVLLIGADGTIEHVLLPPEGEGPSSIAAACIHAGQMFVAGRRNGFVLGTGLPEKFMCTASLRERA